MVLGTCLLYGVMEMGTFLNWNILKRKLKQVSMYFRHPHLRSLSKPKKSHKATDIVHNVASRQCAVLEKDPPKCPKMCEGGLREVRTMSVAL